MNKWTDKNHKMKADKILIIGCIIITIFVIGLEIGHKLRVYELRKYKPLTADEIEMLWNNGKGMEYLYSENYDTVKIDSIRYDLVFIDSSLNQTPKQ